MNAAGDLAAFQDDFIGALLAVVPQHADALAACAPDAAAARVTDGPGADARSAAAARQADIAAIVAQPGFAVYRNTILKGCIDNLAANFPTVQRLVGEAWFQAAALVYARAEPPTEVSLFGYGASLPAFLSTFPPAAELPYLADVARLDRLWIAAHTAADAPSLNAAMLATLAPDALGAAHLIPHPATQWLWCEEHPASAIWSANREQRDTDDHLPWRGDGALLTRPDDAVRWQLIERGTAEFLNACAGGANLQTAAAQALSVQPDLDLAATLAALLQAGAFLPLTDD